MRHNERGAAYAVVIAVMLFLFTVVSSVLYLIRNDTLAASAYANNIGGYEAAKSGVQYALDCINADIWGNKEAAQTAAFTIKTMPTAQVAELLPENAQYQMITDNGVCVFHKTYLETAFPALPDTCSYTLEIRCQTSETYETIYTVSATVTKEAPHKLIINSVAVNTGTGVRDIVRAEAVAVQCSEETVSVENGQIRSLNVGTRAPVFTIHKLRLVQ